MPKGRVCNNLFREENSIGNKNSNLELIGQPKSQFIKYKITQIEQNFFCRKTFDHVNVKCIKVKRENALFKLLCITTIS